MPPPPLGLACTCAAHVSRALRVFASRGLVVASASSVPDTLPSSAPFPLPAPGPEHRCSTRTHPLPRGTQLAPTLPSTLPSTSSRTRFAFPQPRALNPKPRTRVAALSPRRSNETETRLCLGACAMHTFPPPTCGQPAFTPRRARPRGAVVTGRGWGADAAAG